MLEDDFSSFKEIVQPGRPGQPALLLWHAAGPAFLCALFSVGCSQSFHLEVLTSNAACSRPKNGPLTQEITVLLNLVSPLKWYYAVESWSLPPCEKLPSDSHSAYQRHGQATAEQWAGDRMAQGSAAHHSLRQGMLTETVTLHGG